MDATLILLIVVAIQWLPAHGFKFNIDFDEDIYDCPGQEDISLNNYIDYRNITFTRISDKEIEVNGLLKAVHLFPPKSKYSVSGQPASYASAVEFSNC